MKRSALSILMRRVALLIPHAMVLKLCITPLGLPVVPEV